MNRVEPELLRLPGADVPDLAIRIVVPTLARNGIRDGLAELVGNCRCECVTNGEPAPATLAPGIGHDRVERLGPDHVGVAAETLTGLGTPLSNNHPGRQENEVQGIRTGFRNARIRGDLLLDKRPNCAIHVGARESAT